MEETIYTYENWKNFLTEYGLQAEDIAAIIGKSKQNIYQQISPKKPLPTWARAMLFVSDKNKITVNCGESMVLPGHEVIKIRPEVFDSMDKIDECGCMVEGRFFKRAKGCKIPRDQHKF